MDLWERNTLLKEGAMLDSKFTGKSKLRLDHNIIRDPQELLAFLQTFDSISDIILYVRFEYY